MIVRKGRVQWHPLRDHLEPMGEEEDGAKLYRLRTDDLVTEDFDTAPSTVVIDEMYEKVTAKHPEPAMDVDGEGAVEPYLNYHSSSHEEVDDDQVDSFDELSGFLSSSSEDEDFDGWSSDDQELSPHDGDASYIAVPIPDGLPEREILVDSSE